MLGRWQEGEKLRRTTVDAQQRVIGKALAVLRKAVENGFSALP
jgi:hypothetical protein